MDENLRQSIALFRYSLIAPLITKTFAQETQKEYLEEISAKSIYHELIAKGYVSYDQISLSTVQRFISHANISSHKLEAIDKFIGSIESIKFISNKQELDYVFLYRVTRKVKNDATISIQNTLFEVPLKYIGETINVRYDPTDMDKAYVFSDRNLLLDSIYPVKRIDNSKIRRDQNIKDVDFSAFSPNDNERCVN